jgi:mRNA-degrading endonuclease toxin of MazEF toxin-antitoxin module
LVAKRNRLLVDPLQGEIWWAEALDKRGRFDRDPKYCNTGFVKHHHRTAYSTIRRIPTEISLEQEQGVDEECAASFDNLQPTRKTLLASRIGQLSIYQADEICRALSALADC